MLFFVNPNVNSYKRSIKLIFIKLKMILIFINFVTDGGSKCKILFWFFKYK